eukprot:UN00305
MLVLIVVRTGGLVLLSFPFPAVVTVFVAVQLDVLVQLSFVVLAFSNGVLPLLFVVSFFRLVFASVFPTVEPPSPSLFWIALALVLIVEHVF